MALLVLQLPNRAVAGVEPAPYVEELLASDQTPLTCFRDKPDNPCGTRDMAEQLYRDAHADPDPEHAHEQMANSARVFRVYFIMLGTSIGQREALLAASASLRTGAYDLAEQQLQVAMRTPDADIEGLALAWTMFGDIFEARHQLGYARHAYWLALELWSASGEDPGASLPRYLRPRVED